ncbi:hypothetical protein J5N97_001729 [Dioscorea zingiberensis]|uniref:ABC transmembrane type-1 domain-containing protein n=1 Tax=Dioscorea zingiberensis TaxID=325984 RepID=A0A9D5BTH1_9LILI|nr:hypothetical protein J5N97_001729 [Dioscorea zingiberensis]
MLLMRDTLDDLRTEDIDVLRVLKEKLGRFLLALALMGAILVELPISPLKLLEKINRMPYKEIVWNGKNEDLVLRRNPFLVKLLDFCFSFLNYAEKFKKPSIRMLYATTVQDMVSFIKQIVLFLAMHDLKAFSQYTSALELLWLATENLEAMEDSFLSEGDNSYNKSAVQIAPNIYYEFAHLLPLTEHGNSFFSSRRRTMLAVAGILVVSGSVAYMQSGLSNRLTMINSSIQTLPGNLEETLMQNETNDNSNDNRRRIRSQKNGGLRSIHVLAAILISRMGPRGMQNLLALVTTVSLYMFDYFENMVYYKILHVDDRINNPEQRIASDVPRFCTELSEIVQEDLTAVTDGLLYTWRLCSYICKAKICALDSFCELSSLHESSSRQNSASKKYITETSYIEFAGVKITASDNLILEVQQFSLRAL